MSRSSITNYPFKCNLAYNFILEHFISMIIFTHYNNHYYFLFTEMGASNTVKVQYNQEVRNKNEWILFTSTSRFLKRSVSKAFVEVASSQRARIQSYCRGFAWLIPVLCTGNACPNLILLYCIDAKSNLRNNEFMRNSYVVTSSNGNNLSHFKCHFIVVIMTLRC